MSNGLIYIPDGYTRKGYIKEVAGLHGSLSFEYRPMLVEHRDRIYAAMRGGRAAEYNQMIRTAVVAQLLNWDAADSDGHPLPISDAVVRRLQSSLYDRLYAIVSGDRPSDLPEDASDEDARQFAEELRRAAESGQTIGAANEEADRKNSSPG